MICFRMSIETDNPQHESVASTLLEQLVINLSNKVQEFEGDQFFPIRLKLQEATATFKVTRKSCTDKLITSVYFRHENSDLRRLY